MFRIIAAPWQCGFSSINELFLLARLLLARFLLASRFCLFTSLVLKPGKPRFHRIEVFPGAREHGLLNLKFLTGHEIKLAQSGLQHGTKVLFQVIAD